MMTAAAWITSIALVAAPPDDRMICRTLKHVVMSASMGFETLNPRQPLAGADMWQTDIQLGYGDMACGVKMAVSPRSYQCVSPHESEAGGDDARIFANFVGTCLGVPMKASGASQVDRTEFSGSVRGVNIRISHDLIIRHGPDQASHSYYLALRVTAPNG